MATGTSAPAQAAETQPPIQIGTEDWKTVVRILQEEVPALEVWAFGSRARRDAKPYSDLDLVLCTTQPLSLAQIARINDAFDASDLTVRVDVVDWASTSQAFRTVIQRDKVILQPAGL